MRRHQFNYKTKTEKCFCEIEGGLNLVTFFALVRIEKLFVVKKMRKTFLSLKHWNKKDIL